MKPFLYLIALFFMTGCWDTEVKPVLEYYDQQHQDLLNLHEKTKPYAKDLKDGLLINAMILHDTRILAEIKNHEIAKQELKQFLADRQNNYGGFTGYFSKYSEESKVNAAYKKMRKALNNIKTWYEDYIVKFKTISEFEGIESVYLENISRIDQMIQSNQSKQIKNENEWKKIKASRTPESEPDNCEACTSPSP